MLLVFTTDLLLKPNSFGVLAPSIIFLLHLSLYLETFSYFFKPYFVPFCFLCHLHPLAVSSFTSLLIRHFPTSLFPIRFLIVHIIYLTPYLYFLQRFSFSSNFTHVLELVFFTLFLYLYSLRGMVDILSW